MLLDGKSIGRWACVALVLAVGLCLAVAAPTAAATGGGRDGPQRAYEAFGDDHIGERLEEHRIPGAAVAIASTDGLEFARGYGVEDLGTSSPVSAERSVFAPASISKLITATAVMQLVESGRIDLDTDVNEYLTEVEIDDTYPSQPITMRHLLTHTAGFAAGDYGTAAASPHEVDPLGDHLAAHQPERVRRPGTTAVYSNYGMGLAGHVVEARSGVPFDQYVEDNILDPLDMTSTTFAQPEPRAIAEDLVSGYRLQGDRQVREESALYGHMPPHGAGFRSTATDMAAFMEAHLDDGGDILEPESVREMQGRRFGNAEGTAGMGLGFQEYTRNGRRVIVHRGEVPGYVSILALIPEKGIGLYAHYNGAGDGSADSTWGLVDAFVDRFAASDPPGTGGSASAPDAEALPDTQEFTGTYRPTMIGDTGDLGALGGLTSVVSVSADADGTLTTTGPVGHEAPRTREWSQVEPGLFEESGGDRRIQFDEHGRLATDDPTGPLERLAWYELPTVHLGAVGVSAVILLPSALVWPIVAFARRGRRRSSKGARLAGYSAWACAVLVAASLGSLVAMFANFDEHQPAFLLGGSPMFSVIQTLPVLAAAATAVTLVTTVIAWRRGWWSRVRRLHHTTVALAAVAYLGVAATYNLFG